MADWLDQMAASCYDNEDRKTLLLLRDQEHQDLDVRRHHTFVQQLLLPLLQLLDSSNVKDRDDVAQRYREVMDQTVILENLTVVEEHCLEV